MSKYSLFFVMSVMSLVSLAASHHPEEFLKEISGSKTEASKIVQHYCAMCHAPNPVVPVGAPLMGDEAAWKPRIKKGLDQLFTHLSEGYNAMPARGGCFECTDKQLMQALLALLPKHPEAKQTTNKTIKKALR